MFPKVDMPRYAAQGRRLTFGFFVATILGALLFVCGVTIIYFDYRLFLNDLRTGLWAQVGITAVGFGLILLAILSLRDGRAQKTIVVFRNAVAALAGIGVLAVALLLLLRPAL